MKEMEGIRELIEKGMKAVYEKLREDKIKAGQPLVVSDKNGKVILVDPKTMKKICDAE